MNNDITIGKNRFERYKSSWRNLEGVFETPRGKWIVRIKKNDLSLPTTISQHKTEEEALIKYEKLTNKQQKNE